MNQEIDHELVSLVNGAAHARGDARIDITYIEQALAKIATGDISVPMYPSGAPSLKAVYEEALKLMPHH